MAYLLKIVSVIWQKLYAKYNNVERIYLVAMRDGMNHRIIKFSGSRRCPTTRTKSSPGGDSISSGRADTRKTIISGNFGIERQNFAIQGLSDIVTL